MLTRYACHRRLPLQFAQTIKMFGHQQKNIQQPADEGAQPWVEK